MSDALAERKKDEGAKLTLDELQASLTESSVPEKPTDIGVSETLEHLKEKSEPFFQLRSKLEARS